MAKEIGVHCVAGGMLGAGDTVVNKTQLPSGYGQWNGAEGKKI